MALLLRRKLRPFLLASLAVLLQLQAVPASGDVTAPIGEAKLHFSGGAYSEAVVVLEGIVKGDSKNSEALYWLGRSYYELRDYDSAIRFLKDAVQREPRNSQYHQWLGRAYGGKASRERSLSAALKVQKEFEKAV